MPVPSSISDLSTTASSNSPAGGETPKDGDNYIRAHASFIATLRDKLDGTAATGTINAATFTGTHTFSSGNLLAGTYTPTLTNVSGVDAGSSAASTCHYTRLGNVVHVAGGISVKASSSTSVSVGISLPIASAMTGYNQLSGFIRVAPTGGTSSTHTEYAISADTTNDRATAKIGDVGTTSVAVDYSFMFTYLVV